MHSTPASILVDKNRPRVSIRIPRVSCEAPLGVEHGTCESCAFVCVATAHISVSGFARPRDGDIGIPIGLVGIVCLPCRYTIGAVAANPRHRLRIGIWRCASGGYVPLQMVSPVVKVDASLERRVQYRPSRVYRILWVGEDRPRPVFELTEREANTGSAVLQVNRS